LASHSLVGEWSTSKFFGPWNAPHHRVYSWVVHSVHRVQAHKLPQSPSIVASRGYVTPHRWAFCPRNQAWMSTMPQPSVLDVWVHSKVVTLLKRYCWRETCGRGVAAMRGKAMICHGIAPNWGLWGSTHTRQRWGALARGGTTMVHGDVRQAVARRLRRRRYTVDLKPIRWWSHCCGRRWPQGSYFF
jgi:hypothetical protein